MKKKLALIALIGSLTGMCYASTNDGVLATCPCKKNKADVPPTPAPPPSITI